MPVTAAITLVRPSFTLADSGSITPAVFNGVTLTSASVLVSGAVAADGSTPVTGTQSFANLTASGTLVVSGASTLASAGVTGNATVGGTLVVSGAATLASGTVTGALTVGTFTAAAMAGVNQGGVVKTVVQDHLFLAANKFISGDITTSIAVGYGTYTGGLTVNSGAPARFYGSTQIGSAGAVTQEVAHGYLDTTVTLAANATTTVSVNVYGFQSNKAVCSTNHSGLLASCGQISGGSVTVTLRNVSGATITSAAARVCVITMFG